MTEQRMPLRGPDAVRGSAGGRGHAGPADLLAAILAPELDARGETRRRLGVQLVAIGDRIPEVRAGDDRRRLGPRSIVTRCGCTAGCSA